MPCKYNCNKDIILKSYFYSFILHSTVFILIFIFGFRIWTVYLSKELIPIFLKQKFFLVVG